MRVDLVPDVERANAVGLDDGDRGRAGCREIGDGDFCVRRSRRARMADLDIRHRHGRLP